MKTKSYLLCLLFLLFTSTFSWGQEKYRANVQSFTTKDGLSHLDVNCFEKDNKGVMWIGTRDGLNRFDGKKFKIFNKKNGLNHKSINYLYKDGDFLWCIHEDRRADLNLLSIFHTTEEKVYSLEEYLGKIPFRQSEIQKITRFLHLLVIKTKEETYTYSSQNGLKHFPFIRKTELVKGVTEDGDFWLLDKAVPYLHLRKINKYGEELFFIEKKELPFNRSLTFIYQNNKQISYFSYHNELNKTELWLNIDTKGKVETKKAFFYEKGEKRALSGYISKYYSEYNAYWHTTLDTCLLVDLNKNILYEGISGLKNNYFSFLDGDIIWMAHQTNGFVQIEIKKNKFIRLFDETKHGGFRGITKVKNIIYSNAHAKLLTIDTKFKTSQSYLPFILTILKDRQNNLWGFTNHSLIQYNADFEQITSYKYARYNAPVWAMYQDKKGLIWYSNMGLKSFNPKTKKLQKVNFNEFSEIETSIIYHFYEKENGNILLCSTTGLYEMQLGKGIIARYWSGGKGKYYIPATDFRHLYFDKSDKSYWLATNETGLVHWKPQSNTSKSYTFNHQTANIIHAIYPDKFGFVWLSTENGIIQFEKKTGDFKVYSTTEGTSTHEFNRISHFQDENGRIYFGGIKGVTTFEPKDFYQDFYSTEKTKIILIEVSQFKKNAQKSENVSTVFNQKQQVEFYPNDRFLTFIFGLTDYKYSQDVIYYYKIQGLDKNWIKIQDNEITISGMPYGEQVLEVKALLSDGKYTKEHLEIPITIHKPFYLQWWFFVLNFLVIVGLTFLYIRYRTQKFELQKFALEKEVKKRTLKIEKGKEIIEKQTLKLIELDKTKTRFFANVSHELRTPITLIKAPIQSIIKSQRLNERNQYLLNKAAQNTDNLLNLVNEILDLTKLDNQKLQLEEETVIFYNFIRLILSNFQSIAEMQNISLILEYHAQKELQILLDRDKFQKILNNLVSNALKFTPSKGKIVISVQDLGTEILLKVRDNGRGIPEVDIPHVFERYFQSSQNNKAEGGLGIGLALCMELLKLCKGKIWLESSTSKGSQGTTFFVKFPKKEVLNMLSTQDAEDIERDFSNQKVKGIIPKVKNPSKKGLKTILIVEDNKDLREYLSFILSASYTILTAENGKKALELIANNQIPNLIISDLMMPIMDGQEFLEAVKNNDKLAGVPFIMLTARVILQDKLRALRVGVDDYITKPFEEDELQVRIENLLANYEERVNFIQSEQENTGNTAEKETKFNISLEDRKWLEDFENLILKHLGSSLFTVDYLAELMSLGRTSLYKKVKTLTGLSPNQYIKVIRLKTSKDYLENKKYKTIKEVANHVGFTKAEYFSTLFKKEYGKSPNDYLNTV